MKQRGEGAAYQATVEYERVIMLRNERRASVEEPLLLDDNTYYSEDCYRYLAFTSLDTATCLCSC